MNVDIASIGGVPADSRDRRRERPATSVGGHPNSTAAEEAEKAKVEAAKWSAYYKSGEIVLVIVISPRRRGDTISGESAGNVPVTKACLEVKLPWLLPALGMDREVEWASRVSETREPSRDIEAADFDESELDELHVETPARTMEHRTASGVQATEEELDDANAMRMEDHEVGKGRADDDYS